MKTKSHTRKIKIVLSLVLIFQLVLSSLGSLNFIVLATETEHKAVIFEDDFNRADGDIHGDNDWYSVWTGSADKPSHKLENGQLLLHDYSNGGDSFSSRPASEDKVNQRVSVDIINLDKLANYATANVYLRFRRSNNYSQNSDCGYRVVVTNEYIRLSRDGNKWDKSGITTGGENVAYTHKYGHKYRVEFTAIGTNPTLLSATLYDVTAGNVAVANVSGSDTTSYLQSAGTAALGATKNGAGQTTAIYDNFKYEEILSTLTYDEFNRADGSVDNDWVLGSKANAVISSGALMLSTKRGANDDVQHISETALLRPMSQSSLDQTVSADFKSIKTAPDRPEGEYADQGGVVIARCQGSSATDNNCYRLYAIFGYEGAKNWKTPVYVMNSLGEVIYTTNISRSSAQRYRLELSTVSISDTETSVTAKIHDLDENGNITGTPVNATVVDDDPNLQKAGTAGVSMYDKWGGILSVDNFNYTVPVKMTTPVTYSYFELESDLNYKNNYVNAEESEALSEKAVKPINITEYVAYDKISDSLNNESGYIACPVFADTQGSYDLRLRYKFGCDNQSDYNNYVSKSGDVSAVAVVNGEVYRFNNSAEPNKFGTSDAVDVNLKSGVNIIYLFAPDIEIAKSINGAFIDYDCLFMQKGLTYINGTFVKRGDINSDGAFNIKDLVRFKRYLSGDSVSVNRFSADLDRENNDNILNSLDIVILRKALLGTETENFSSKVFTWLEHLNENVINPVAVMEEKNGGADAQAETMRNDITASEDKLNITGKTYYISQNGNDSADGTSPQTAWKTLNKLAKRRIFLKSGDAVLFERGSVFRCDGTETDGGIVAVSGVTYGAYGTGDKPRIYGSVQNYANAKWSLHAGNVWKLEFNLADAGVIVFDNGGSVGVKKFTLDSVESGNDFYHDTENNLLYLCSPLGCPSDVYDSIEIGTNCHLFRIFTGRTNIVIDNLDIRFVGAHGIKGDGSNKNIKITNCEFSWIGGSSQSGTVRYGNAVEFWNSCSGITVENCLIKQVYDAALTFQGENGSEYSDIFFKNNLIKYCNYSVEFFIKSDEDGNNQGLMSNIDIIGNILQFAGHGFCEQRPSKTDSSHICGWATDIGGNVKDFCIKDNIFDLSAFNIVNWSWSPNLGINVSGNSYYMEPSVSQTAMKYGNNPQFDAYSQETLEKAVAVFDSEPSLVKWLGR